MKDQILSLLVDVKSLQEKILSREIEKILLLDRINDHLQELTALVTSATTTERAATVESHDKGEGETTATTTDPDNKQTRLNL